MDILKLQAYHNLGFLTYEELENLTHEDLCEQRGHLGRDADLDNLELVSNCCGAKVVRGTCMDCQEPCAEVVEE